MRQLLGNLLIISSGALLVFTYLPLLQFFLPSSRMSLPSDNGFYISIPKISAMAPIVAGVDPWNESVYRRALQKGVAQAKSSSLPGEGGTVYLFAHSSLPPWEMTRINTAFLRLGELNPGDKIAIYMYGREYDYIVRDKKELWPNEIRYLSANSGNQLILQTCIPPEPL